jgi:DNA processing protein
VLEVTLPDALEIPGSLLISPFREFGAYEALWMEPGASFRTIADRFRARPGALPSDFIEEADALVHAERVREMLRRGGIEDFGICVHGQKEYPEKLRGAAHPVELLYFQGCFDFIRSRSIAVVGTRNASELGIARAKKLIRNLVADEFTIISVQD